MVRERLALGEESSFDIRFFQSEKAVTPVPKSSTPTSSGSTTPGPSAPLKPGAVIKPPHLRK